MTLSERNSFFKVGIVFCAILALLVAAASFLLFPAYPEINENIHRPVSFINAIFAEFLNHNYFAVHISIVLTVLFSLIAIFLIHSYFEQTPATEIFYIALFVISLSLEVIRLILPLYTIYAMPSLYLLIVLRILLFTRFFGIFSLFAASICAAGLEIQQMRSIIIVILVAALAITIGIPIDIQNWDTSFNVTYGFNTMLKGIEIAVLLITVLSFFAAVKIRNSKEYGNIGIGLLFALIGRYFLLHLDNWAGLAGIFMLSFGIWFICIKLHKIYLWL